MTPDNRWGTIAFDLAFMRKTIGVGREVFRDGEFLGFTTADGYYALNVGVWLEGFVPPVYRAQLSNDVVLRLIGPFRYEKATPQTLDQAIMTLYSWIVKNVEPVHPVAGG